jgi:hypothetical protein
MVIHRLGAMTNRRGKELDSIFVLMVDPHLSQRKYDIVFCTIIKECIWSGSRLLDIYLMYTIPYTDIIVLKACN